MWTALGRLMNVSFLIAIEVYTILASIDDEFWVLQ